MWPVTTENSVEMSSISALLTDYPILGKEITSMMPSPNSWNPSYGPAELNSAGVGFFNRISSSIEFCFLLPE